MNEAKSGLHRRCEGKKILYLSPLSLCLSSSWDLHNQAGDRGQHAACSLFIIHASPPFCLRPHSQDDTGCLSQTKVDPPRWPAPDTLLWCSHATAVWFTLYYSCQLKNLNMDLIKSTKHTHTHILEKLHHCFNMYIHTWRPSLWLHACMRVYLERLRRVTHRQAKVHTCMNIASHVFLL